MRTSHVYHPVQAIRRWLTQRLVSSNELQVWQTTDRAGQTYWHAYDPVTHASVVCQSESEMATWIEEAYYTTRFHPSDYWLDRHRLMPSR
ncbi:hypothetical protein [Egbenema bharatensis]|uniref:hypothetical protein n=1 Tax=Egbenema bharatensis TaxID=3463334 RepID=UPI003A8A65EA